VSAFTISNVLKPLARRVNWPQTGLMRRRMLWAYLFVSMPILGLLLFSLGPILFTGWVSLHDWDMLSPPAEMPWRGLDNYVFLLTQDPVFGKALVNTFVFAVVGVMVNIILGLAFAMLLNSRVRGKTFWRTVYFLPVISAPLALGVIFNFIFNRNYGLANNIIVGLGMQRQPFLTSPDQALLVIILIAIYEYIGYYIVIFVAGLQGIPQDYYDAARVDGANRRQEFRAITLPLLRPVIAFILITNSIGALQVFDVVYATTQGSPANSTMTTVLYMYNTAFKFSRMGRASAMAFILFTIIMVITIVQTRLLRDQSVE
jgi:multiple sugar transport system permease protein